MVELVNSISTNGGVMIIEKDDSIVGFLNTVEFGKIERSE